MSKINKRNFVKKHMEKFHRHKVEESGKVYVRCKEHKKFMEEIENDEVVAVPVRKGL